MAITYLIELFPLGGKIDPRDRAEFNRLVDMEYDRVRDFLILHYHATTRDDSEFWNHVRTMAVPDSLAGKIELWRETGRIEKYADGLFYDASWIAVYLGLVVRYHGWGGVGHAGVAPYGAAIDPKLRTRFARDWGGGPRNASTAAPPG